jgi:hypothetical protein
MPFPTTLLNNATLTIMDTFLVFTLSNGVYIRIESSDMEDLMSSNTTDEIWQKILTKLDAAYTIWAAQQNKHNFLGSIVTLISGKMSGKNLTTIDKRKK